MIFVKIIKNSWNGENLMADFYTSLKDGKKVDEKVCNMIKKKYPKTHMIDGYCKEYDIFIPEKDFGIEVKKDVKSQETGNYVIEIEFDDKPSALMTTKAEYWVIYDGECYIWIKPKMLKALVSIMGDGRLAKFIGKGDTKHKRAFLMPKEIIKNNASKIYHG